MPTFDDHDKKILAQREAYWNSKSGPRVGDFCRMPDGSLRRFTYDWGDLIQLDMPEISPGSFYFDLGYASYSGGLDSGIEKKYLSETKETHKGRFWFFHHDLHVAHNGVEFEIDCRVYLYKPKAN